MLAARMYDVGDMRLEEVPVPDIGPDELLLKVKAAAICGTDVRMFYNGYPGIGPGTPRTLGHELAGVIELTGSAVTAYAPGQRVAIAPTWAAASATIVSGGTGISAGIIGRWESIWTAVLQNTAGFRLRPCAAATSPCCPMGFPLKKRRSTKHSPVCVTASSGAISDRETRW